MIASTYLILPFEVKRHERLNQGGTQEVENAILKAEIVERAWSTN